MPEITDEELRILTGSRQLMDKLLKNPKTQLATQKLIKEAVPDAGIQTVEDHPLFQQLQETQKELRDLRKTMDEERVDSKLNDEFGILRQNGYQDEGIEEIKKYMLERKIPSPIDAAAAWEKQNPPKPVERPSTYNPDSWGFGRPAGDDKDLALLYRDEDAWADQEVGRVMQEFAKANQIRV